MKFSLDDKKKAENKIQAMMNSIFCVKSIYLFINVFWKWSWRDSNSRPVKVVESFLHA